MNTPDPKKPVEITIIDDPVTLDIHAIDPATGTYVEGTIHGSRISWRCKSRIEMAHRAIHSHLASLSQ